MKKQRINVFETNSSSTHSISFNPWKDEKKDKKETNLKPDKDGVIRIDLTNQEIYFGWDWEGFNDSVSKAYYYIGRYKHNEERLELLTKAIEEFTGYKAEIIGDPNNISIDHQSSDELELSSTTEDVKNFIFNSDVWVYTGNDNSEAPFNLRCKEIISLSDDPCYITLKLPDDTTLETVLPEYPSENNVLNFLGAINYNDEDYELEEFDLQNNILKYYDRWSSSSDSDTIIVKIIKITNKEFGTIENG